MKTNKFKRDARVDYSNALYKFLTDNHFKKVDEELKNMRLKRTHFFVESGKGNLKYYISTDGKNLDISIMFMRVFDLEWIYTICTTEADDTEEGANIKYIGHDVDEFMTDIYEVFVDILEKNI